MFKRQFDEITKDIGKTIKETARSIFVTANWSFFVFCIIEIIFTIGVIIDDDELFGLVILLPIALAVEYLIFYKIVHLITIKLYAKGEIVHLLKKDSSDDSAQKTDTKPATTQENNIKPAIIQEADKKTENHTQAEKAVVPDTWVCKICSTHNSNKYSQCKKCGTYRS